jgi:hypothetical protein
MEPVGAVVEVGEEEDFHGWRFEDAMVGYSRALRERAKIFRVRMKLDRGGRAVEEEECPSRVGR